MTMRFRLIFMPAAVTLAGTLCRFVMEAVGIPGASMLNIAWLMPVFGVYFAIICLRQGMGYGGFTWTFLLYTLVARLPVILLSLIGQASGLETSYFAYRNILFGLILPQLILWPIASLIIGTLLWPIFALFTKGRQVSYRGVILSLVVVLLIIFGGMPYAISRLYTGGIARRSFTDTPEKYGIAYDDLTLTTSDGLALRGWYLPNPDDRGTVIFCHGLFNQRSELLEQAVFMHEQGFRAVLFDFRHHGQSDGSYVTFGYYERRDVEAALRYVIDDRGEQGAVILWGISMGAANALLATAEQPEVTAIIAESSFYSARETLQRDLTRMFQLPAFPFASLVEFFTDHRLGIHIGDIHVGDAAARIHDRPILLIGGTNDRRIPIINNERLFTVIPGDMKEQWVVEGAGHADIWRMVQADYRAKVTQFLERYIRTDEQQDEPIPVSN